MPVKANENSATVALAKGYGTDAAVVGPKYVGDAKGVQINSFNAEVPMVTGEFQLKKGSDTIEIVGLNNCSQNIRPDYIEIEKIRDNVSTADAAELWKLNSQFQAIGDINYSFEKDSDGSTYLNLPRQNDGPKLMVKGSESETGEFSADIKKDGDGPVGFVLKGGDLRYGADAFNGYEIGFVKDGEKNFVRVGRHVNNFNKLQDFEYTPSGTGWDNLKVVYTANTYEIFVNGTSLGVCTDDAPEKVTSGQVGFRNWNGGVQYKNIKFKNGDGQLTDISLPKGKMSASDGLDLSAAPDNSSPWGDVSALWVKKGTPGSSLTLPVYAPAAGDYKVYFSYKSRESSTDMQVSVNGAEVGEPVHCYAAGNGSNRADRGRKYFEPLAGTTTIGKAGYADVTFTFVNDEHADKNDGSIFVPVAVKLVPIYDTQNAASEGDNLPLSMLHYNFDSAAKDVSGHGNTGILSDSGVKVAGGQADFTGGNVEVPIGAVSKAKTISMLVRANEMRNWTTLFEAGNSDSFVKIAGQSDDQGRYGISLTVKGKGTAEEVKEVRVMGNKPLNIQEWTEITFVQQDDGIVLYLNGEKAETAVFFKEQQEGALEGRGLQEIVSGAARLGSGAVWPDPAMQGSVADFRMYDQALSAEQVAALAAFNAKSVSEPETPEATIPDSVLHYTFDGLTEDGKVKDMAGNYDGAFVNYDNNAITAEEANIQVADGKATFSNDKSRAPRVSVPVEALRQENVTVSMMINVDKFTGDYATIFQAGERPADLNDADRASKDYLLRWQPFFAGRGNNLQVWRDGVVRDKGFNAANFYKIPMQNWVQMTFSISATGEIKMYYNGEELSYTAGGEGWDGVDRSNLSFKNLSDYAIASIGAATREWGDADPGLKGQISDFRVFNQVLSTEQVAALTAENMREFNADPYKDLSAEAAAVAAMIDALPGETTHRQGPAYREAQAAFDALNAAQKAELTDARAEKLAKVGSDLEALYDAFTAHAECSWTNDKGEALTFSQQPWFNDMTDQEKADTLNAFTDEIRNQYVTHGYLLGSTDGTYGVGNWENRLNMNIGDNADNNDNIGSPDVGGWGGKAWSNLTAPFKGMAFSFKDVMGACFPWTIPLTNSFEYDGRIYQVTWEKVYSYKAGVKLEKGTSGDDIRNNAELDYQEEDNYPGKGRHDYGDMTNNSFRYAYARYNQAHKWEKKVVGVPVSSEFLKSAAGVQYQRFVGPQGIAYVAGTGAVDKEHYNFEGAYVIIGEMARALESLGADANAWFTITGLPTAEAVTAADGTVTQTFANGILKAANGKYSFMSAEDTQKVQEVEGKIAAAGDIENIGTLEDLKGKIAEAQAAYDALDDATLQGMVSNYASIEALNENVAKVEAVETQIGALPEAATIVDTETAEAADPDVKSAEAALAALGDYKKYVTSTEKVEGLRTEINKYLISAEVKAVEEMIDAIGELPEENAYKVAPKVWAAKNAYDALSSENQGKVDGAKKTLLDDAVAAMEALKANYDGSKISDTPVKWTDEGLDQTPWMVASKHQTDESKQVVYDAMRDEAAFQYAHEGYDMGYVTASPKGVQVQEGLLIVELGDGSNGGDNIAGANPWYPEPFNQKDRKWAAVVAPYDGVAFSVKSPFGFFGMANQMLLGNVFEYNGKAYQLAGNGYVSYDLTLIPEEMYSWDYNNDIKGNAEREKAIDDLRNAVMSSRVDQYPGRGDDGTDVTNNTFKYAAALYNQKVKWDGKTLGIPTGNTETSGSAVYQAYEGPNGEAYIVGSASAINKAKKDVPAEVAYVLNGSELEAVKAQGATMAEALAVTGAPTEAKPESGAWQFENGEIENGVFKAYTPVEIVEKLIEKVSIAEITNKEERANVGDAYETAKAAYDALTEPEQGEVKNAGNLEKAAEAMTTFDKREKEAKEMSDRLTALPYEIKYIDDAAREAIAQARVDYENLEPITKSLVTQQSVGYLGEAEDAVIAADFTVLYKKVPADYQTAWAELDPETYLESDEYTTYIAPLKAAYEALTDFQKGLVKDYDPDMLGLAKEAIDWRPIPEEEIIEGDVNRDGKVNITDVMEMCRMLARKTPGMEYTKEELAAADLNHDNTVTITDVMMLCKVLASREQK